MHSSEKGAATQMKVRTRDRGATQKKCLKLYTQVRAKHLRDQTERIKKYVPLMGYFERGARKARDKGNELLYECIMKLKRRLRDVSRSAAPHTPFKGVSNSDQVDKSSFERSGSLTDRDAVELQIKKQSDLSECCYGQPKRHGCGPPPCTNETVVSFFFIFGPEMFRERWFLYGKSILSDCPWILLSLHSHTG